MGVLGVTAFRDRLDGNVVSPKVCGLYSCRARKLDVKWRIERIKASHPPADGQSQNVYASLVLLARALDRMRINESFCDIVVFSGILKLSMFIRNEGESEASWGNASKHQVTGRLWRTFGQVVGITTSRLAA